MNNYIHDDVPFYTDTESVQSNNILPVQFPPFSDAQTPSYLYDQNTYLPSPPETTRNDSSPSSRLNSYLSKNVVTDIPLPFDETTLLPHYLSFTTPVEHFTIWSTRMCLALESAGLLTHITQGLFHILTDHKFTEWVKQDEMAKRMIMSKLSDEALGKLLSTKEKARELLRGTGKRDSAFGMWVYLKFAYGGLDAGSGEMNGNGSNAAG